MLLIFYPILFNSTQPVHLPPPLILDSNVTIEDINKKYEQPYQPLYGRFFCRQRISVKTEDAETEDNLKKWLCGQNLEKSYGQYAKHIHKSDNSTETSNEKVAARIKTELEMRRDTESKKMTLSQELADLFKESLVIEQKRMELEKRKQENLERAYKLRLLDNGDFVPRRPKHLSRDQFAKSRSGGRLGRIIF